MAIQGSRPRESRTIAPNLIVRGVEEAIRFYEQALGAEALYRGAMPGGPTLHAQLRVAGSFLLLSDEIMKHPEMRTGSPETIGGSSAIYELFVEDADAAFERAAKAGATPVNPVNDAFYGDRTGIFADPFGHLWSVSAPTEVLTPEQIQARMLEHFSEMQGSR
jgi:PhnB protein